MEAMPPAVRHTEAQPQSSPQLGCCSTQPLAGEARLEVQLPLSVQGHPILQAELRRCERRIEMAKLDQSRVNLDPPPANRSFFPPVLHPTWDSVCGASPCSKPL